MPIETAAVNGVRPVARPQAPGGVDGVNRRDGESTPSGFRPQTNVSIENAVSDMAGILSKISSEEMETVEKMPQDLQKVIENVMKQAFSFDQTLAEGLGSTMESQRFSMEQLTTVARTLLQMSSLAEKGYDVNISDGLQTLLTNLKAAVTQEAGGNAFEPVLLLKASFDLINGKDPQDLPAALQQLIASLQTAGAQGQQTTASDAPGFLKQLVQYFMPRSDASAEGGAQTAGQPAAQEGQAAQGQATAQTAQQGMTQTGQTGQAAQGQQAQNGGAQQTGQNAQGQPTAGNGNGAGTTQTAQNAQTAQNVQQGGAAQNAQGQTAQGQPTQANAQNAQGAAQQQGTASQTAQSQATQGQAAQGQSAPQNGTSPQNPSNANGAAQGNSEGQPAAGQPQNAAQTANGANGQNAQNTSQMARQQGAVLQQPSTPVEEPQAQTTGQAPQNAQNAEGQQAARSQQQAPMQEQLRQMPQTQQDQNLTMTAREAKELLMQQPMQNTPESMQTMKDLARLFLQKGTLSQADANLLQNFIDGQGKTLSTKESRQLETLLRLCQQNIPATVQQAALQHDMPELPRLWAFMQLCDLSVAKKLNARQLKKAGKDVAEFVFSMRGLMEGDHAIQPGQRSMNFMMPLYLGENEKSYPAYIHVYDETKPDKETGALKKETWLRLCVLTENLGAVELTCRVYEHEHLDMRLFFANRETAQQFRDYVPELRRSMRGSKLHLKDVAIGAPGE